MCDKVFNLRVGRIGQQVSVTVYLFGQSRGCGFMSRSRARVILGQVLSIATCGTRTHRGSGLLLDAELANHKATKDFYIYLVAYYIYLVVYW